MRCRLFDNHVFKVTLSVLLGLAVSLATMPVSYAADPAVKCEAGKLKESSKYAGCRLKAESKGVKKGLSADFTKCETKFTEKFNKAETKAGLGVCPSEGDETDINGRITLHAAELATLLAGGVLPTCGDAIVDPGEQCDNGDLGAATCVSLGFAGGTLACDASCFFDLTGCSSSSCGNGVADGTDQCDAADLAGADCTTLGFTGGALACGPACFFDLSACTAGGGGLVPGVDPILPATGQATAFGPGSDGAVLAGNALSYTDNGDGTIADNNTGLMWEKKDDSGGIHDKDDLYTWSTGTNNMDGTMVTAFLDSLNDVAGGGASCFAGHCDWRIPNVKELQSIVDYHVFDPSIDPAFHQAATCTGCTDVAVASCSCTGFSTFCWSSTTLASTAGNARLVDFAGGGVGNASKSGNWCVRAVRGGL